MPKPIKEWLKYKRTLRYLLFIYFIFLLIVTLSPMDEVSKINIPWLRDILQIENIDKIVHFGLFFILAVLVSLSFEIKNIYKILILLFISILIEIMQYLLPFGRAFEVLDILANFIGILIAFFIVNKLIKA